MVSLKAIFITAFVSNKIGHGGLNNERNSKTILCSIEPVSKSSIAVSVIIPAYNEGARIYDTIITYSSHLIQNYNNFEVLVVDDGSIDDTVEVVRKAAGKMSIPFQAIGKAGFTNRNVIVEKPCTAVRCLSMPKNVGKGKALAAGIQYSNADSRFVLVTDADGSADITCLDTMIDIAITSFGDKIVAGRRKQQDDMSSLKRSILRVGFKTTVQILCFPIRVGNDTQCGFKLFPRSKALYLYNKIHLDRWSHDVEVLYLAAVTGMQVKEADVGWKDMPGSKLVGDSAFDVIAVSMQMLLEVFYMRIMYVLGIWKVDYNYYNLDEENVYD